MLCRDYHINDICGMMHVSRSGYYKWKKREPSRRALSREKVIEMVKSVHEGHTVHGYRWIAAYIRINLHYSICDNYVYKCCRYLGVKSSTRHTSRSHPRRVKDKFPNLIFSTWDTVDRPRQVIVSDMTAMHIGSFYIELTFYFDVFTKELLTWRIGERRGDRMQYIGGLEDIVNMLKGSTEPTVLHTDQGSVYASVAYNELIKESLIVRSMSRAGKPTDNPVNESLNGWIKEELYADFHIGECRNRDDVANVINQYVLYYNNIRPCYAIGYNTPSEFKKMYYNNIAEHRNTFETRKLSPLPKFVQKRKQKIENQKQTTQCTLL